MIKHRNRGILVWPTYGYKCYEKGYFEKCPKPTSDANPNRNPNPDPAPTQLEFVSKKRIKRISVSNDSPLKIFVSIFK